MLVLVILRTNTSVLFVFNVRLHIIPGVTRIIFNKSGSEGLKNSKTFWLASALVEAGAGQDSGSCMPPRLRNAVQHFQSN